MSNQRRRSTTLVTCVLAIALCLTGCSPELANPNSPPPTPFATPAPSATPTGALPTTPADPSPTPSATAVASTFSMPKNCRSLVSARDYPAIFGKTPINHPNFVGASGPTETGAVTPRAAPGGASTEVILRSAIQLSCLWADPAADVTHIVITIATVSPAVAETFLASQEAKGYTCSAVHGGKKCQMIGKNEQHSVDQGDTDFLRDDIYITVGQVNFATSDLIGTLTRHLWG